MASLIDYLAVVPQYLLPQHFLSKAVKQLALVENPSVRTRLIKLFLAKYDVDLSEAEYASVKDYPHFNALFTRRLKSGARQIVAGENTVCSPADGIISQYGQINQGSLIQAKGREFTVLELLAEPAARANRYEGGTFSTIYLAPHNYHRVHVPISGQLIHAKYIPGKLFSVNTRTARTVPRLFARNERVVIEIQSKQYGRVVLVMVGALLVASIGLEFLDMESQIYRNNCREITTLTLPKDRTSVTKGESIGWFNMGSTVILLAENRDFQFDPVLIKAQKIRMGEALGRF